MTVSVNTNRSALSALQNLNRTAENLAASQNRVNTGLRISGAKDNAAVYAIAQGQRADMSALGAVKMSLDRATSIADVAIAAGESVSDLLNQLKERVLAATESSRTPESRSALDADFKAILKSLATVVSNAKFDGANILNGTITADLQFLADADATSFVNLGVKDMRLGRGIITIPAAASIATATAAGTILAQLEASIGNVNGALAEVGAQAKQIESHNRFVSKLVDVIESGIGNLVDADLAKESARLQALQVQQQLGTQALSIANQAPQIVLQLFRNG